MRLAISAFVTILVTVAFPGCAAKNRVNVVSSSIQAQLAGGYDIVELSVGKSVMPVKVGGHFHFQDGGFAYTFLLDGRKVFDFKGEVITVSPDALRLSYKGFTLFIEKHDYFFYDHKGVRYMSLSPPHFVRERINESLKELNRPEEWEFRLILRKRT